MKLHASLPAAANTITGYGDDYVAVNGERHASSLIVTAEQVQRWQVSAFDSLSSEDFEALKGLGVEIVILGTGPRQRFRQAGVREALLRPRAEQQDFQVQAEEQVEIRFRERVERRGAPRQQLSGHHDDIGFVAFAVDRHEALAVTGEGVERARR